MKLEFDPDFFIKTLKQGIEKIDIEKAEVWSVKDKDMILDAAWKSEGGIEGVRERVIQPLWNWMTNEALEMVKNIKLRY